MKSWFKRLGDSFRGLSAKYSHSAHALGSNCRVYLTGKEWMVSAALVCAFLYFADLDLFRDWLAMLYPSGDEFSLMAESENSPWQWFAEGYSRYFVAYPEYFEPYSNFIRPVANALYRMFSCTDCYRLQLELVNYAVHAGMAGGLYLIGIRLGNSKTYSLGLALAAFLAPAFWGSKMTIYPSFTLDGLAAALCLSAVYLLFTRYAWLGFVLLAAAAFTKEAALPIATAVAAYSIIFRRWAWTSMALSVLLFWAGVRFLAFGGMGGIYSFYGDDGVQSLIARWVALRLLPISYPTVPGNWLFLACNIAVWILLFILLSNRQFARNVWVSGRRFVEEGKLDRPAHLQVLCAICVVFSAAYFALIGGTARFSYVFYISFLAMLACAFPYARLRGLTLVLLICSSFAAALVSFDRLRSEKDYYATRYEAARDLVSELRASDKSGEPIFVVNDFVSGFSTEENVARVAGVRDKIYRGSSIQAIACSKSQMQAITTRVERDDGSVKILRIRLPGCARFSFEGAREDMILAHMSGSRLYRNLNIGYFIPGLRVLRERQTGKERIYDFGKTMTVIVKDSAVVYFDFPTGKWVYLS